MFVSSRVCTGRLITSVFDVKSVYSKKVIMALCIGCATSTQLLFSGLCVGEAAIQHWLSLQRPHDIVSDVWFRVESSDV